MLLISSIAIAALSAGLLFAGGFLLSRRFAGSSGIELQNLVTEIEEANKKVDALKREPSRVGSTSQLSTLDQQTKKVQSEIDAEKSRLREIESKLDTAQRAVEGKETAQQEMKAARSEDEQKLQELLSSYATISEESILLEQQLASSLKNLDRIMEEVELTQDQKTLLSDLSTSLSAAGSRLRELLTEYEKVNERLTMLKTQHEQLEEEYTKLVEQQLGE